ncbi:uncharacterized protein BJ171DRAFT_476904 [Polychytrium aggregatum]|uniref:uncharacterized protein n=1 Tax=Polychytrium aggregatum TaxID=110093 RepID=UPI0022FE7779|nr:uncharacterized protein BJ171DRAFT_476904 [Polychytrium aggregatum]KAI9202244.1 hypothetical protein BJ171DRAFT_476904 [Polychytrium aggregatum]
MPSILLLLALGLLALARQCVGQFNQVAFNQLLGSACQSCTTGPCNPPDCDWLPNYMGFPYSPTKMAANVSHVIRIGLLMPYSLYYDTTLMATNYPYWDTTQSEALADYAVANAAAAYVNQNDSVLPGIDLFAESLSHELALMQLLSPYSVVSQARGALDR